MHAHSSLIMCLAIEIDLTEVKTSVTNGHESYLAYYFALDGSRDAAVERTGTYLPRVPKK